MPRRKKDPFLLPEDDILKQKVFNITELRMGLAEFTKEGKQEMSIFELLLWVKGLVKD